jgi:hypothetical protein
MLREWPMPDVPPLVKRYYDLIPYNYAAGPLNIVNEKIKYYNVVIYGLLT